MKKVTIPFIRKSVPVKFPNKCVCCRKPMETALTLHFSKKVVLSSIWIGDEEKELLTNTYVADFKIPYCAKHAKRTLLIENIKEVAFWVSSIVSAASVLYLFIRSISISGIREWIGAIIVSIIGGLLIGSLLSCVLSLFLFISIKEYPLSVTLMNASLGIKVKLSPDRTGLVFFFTNKEFAREFEYLSGIMSTLYRGLNRP